MSTSSATWTERLRGAFTAVLVIAVLIGSFGVVTRALAAAAVALPDRTVVGLATPDRSPAKPCKRTLPGTAAGCVSTFAFGVVAQPGTGVAVTWSGVATLLRVDNSSLPPQCGGHCPYRPPRLTA